MRGAPAGQASKSSFRTNLNEVQIGLAGWTVGMKPWKTYAGDLEAHL